MTENRQSLDIDGERMGGGWTKALGLMVRLVCSNVRVPHPCAAFLKVITS